MDFNCFFWVYYFFSSASVNSAFPLRQGYVWLNYCKFGFDGDHEWFIALCTPVLSV